MSRSRGFLLPPVDSLVNPHPTTCYRRTALYNEGCRPFVSPPRKIDHDNHPTQGLPLECIIKWWQSEDVTTSLVLGPSLTGRFQRPWGFPGCRLTDGSLVMILERWKFDIHTWWGWIGKDLAVSVLVHLKLLDLRAEKAIKDGVAGKTMQFWVGKFPKKESLTTPVCPEDGCSGCLRNVVTCHSLSTMWQDGRSWLAVLWLCNSLWRKPNV